MAHAASGGGRDQVERLTGQPEVNIHTKRYSIAHVLRTVKDSINASFNCVWEWLTTFSPVILVP